MYAVITAVSFDITPTMEDAHFIYFLAAQAGLHPYIIHLTRKTLG
jgi:hypothetical protein